MEKITFWYTLKDFNFNDAIKEIHKTYLSLMRHFFRFGNNEHQHVSNTCFKAVVLLLSTFCLLLLP